MLATDPMESTLPSEPMLRIEPADPMLRMEPEEPIDKIEPTEPMLRMEPAEPMEPAGRDEPCSMRTFSQAYPQGGSACQQSPWWPRRTVRRPAEDVVFSLGKANASRHGSRLFPLLYPNGACPTDSTAYQTWV